MRKRTNKCWKALDFLQERMAEKLEDLVDEDFSFSDFGNIVDQQA